MHSSLRPVTLVAFALAALQGRFASAQTTLYVKADATGASNGTSWVDAFTHPQVALSAAAPIVSGGSLVQIWVTAGTYKPTAMTPPPGPRSVTFQLVNNVSLFGGFAGTETSLSERDLVNPANETILSGDLAGDDGPNFGNMGDNAYHVLIGSGTNASAVLDGFTIRGGNADGAGESGKGGGLYNVTGSPTVRNCAFVGNRSSAGTNGGGGGMYNLASSPMVENCRFVGNSSFGNSQGSGMLNIDGSNPTVVNRLFDRNGQGGQTGYGGGIACVSNSSPQVINCVFRGNTPDFGGGAYTLYSSFPTFLNCVFTGNRVTYDGGGVYAHGASRPVLINCTIAGNYARIGAQIPDHVRGGGIATSDGGGFELHNTILWGNRCCVPQGNDCFMDSSQQAQLSNENNAPLNIEYSCIQNWTSGGIGNMSLDPLPVRVPDIGPDGIPATNDDDFGDLHLQAGSPASDAGNNSVDTDPNTPGIEPLPTTDLEGQPRFQDDLEAPNSGNAGGGGPIVAMGSFETPAQSILVSPQALIAPEGGTVTFTVRPGLAPSGPVQISTVWVSGDPDISVQSGATLDFNSTDYAQPQIVTLAADEDADFTSGSAMFQVSMTGAPSKSVAATEADNDPAPPRLYVDADALPGGSGSSCDRASASSRWRPGIWLRFQPNRIDRNRCRGH